MTYAQTITQMIACKKQRNNNVIFNKNKKRSDTSVYEENMNKDPIGFSKQIKKDDDMFQVEINKTAFDFQQLNNMTDELNKICDENITFLKNLEDIENMEIIKEGIKDPSKPKKLKLKIKKIQPKKIEPKKK